MARLSNGFLQYSDDAGKPLPEGKLYFYDSGTTNFRNTYTDSGLSIANANPLLLDGAGRVNSPFLNGNYRVILTDKDDNQIREIDPVQGSLSDSQWSDWAISTTYGVGDIVRASDGEYYISLTGSNLSNNPTSSPVNWSEIAFVTQWNPNETYAENDNVFESGTQYKSLIDGNLNNQPSLSPGEWGVPTGGVVAGNPVSILTNDVPYLAAGNNLSDVTLASTARTNLGLGNVDDTSDADKPVSTAQQTALDLKQDISGLGTAAFVNTGTGGADVPTTSQADGRYLNETSNLSDLTDATAARGNLGGVQTQGEADARYLNTTGDTATGQISGITPTAAANFSRKDYVDGLFSKAATGYQVLPSGIIIQWTSFLLNSNNVPTLINVPFAFPAAMVHVLGSFAGGANGTCSADPVNTTSLNGYNSLASPQIGRFLAIGF